MTYRDYEPDYDGCQVNKAEAERRMTTPDYVVADHGSIYVLTPQNTAARENLDANVGDEAQWWAGGVAVEHRYIGPLVEQLQQEGWVVI